MIEKNSRSSVSGTRNHHYENSPRNQLNLKVQDIIEPLLIIDESQKRHEVRIPHHITVAQGKNANQGLTAALDEIQFQDKFELLDIVASIDVDLEVEHMLDALFVHDKPEMKFFNQFKFSDRHKARLDNRIVQAQDLASPLANKHADEEKNFVQRESSPFVEPPIIQDIIKHEESVTSFNIDNLQRINKNVDLVKFRNQARIVQSDLSFKQDVPVQRQKSQIKAMEVKIPTIMEQAEQISVMQLSARSQSPYPQELQKPKFIGKQESPEGNSILSKRSSPALQPDEMSQSPIRENPVTDRSPSVFAMPSTLEEIPELLSPEERATIMEQQERRVSTLVSYRQISPLAQRSFKRKSPEPVDDKGYYDLKDLASGSEDSEGVRLKKKIDSVFDTDIDTQLEKNARLVKNMALNYPRIKLLEQEQSRTRAFGKNLIRFDADSKLEKQPSKSLPRQLKLKVQDGGLEKFSSLNATKQTSLQKLSTPVLKQDKSRNMKNQSNMSKNLSSIQNETADLLNETLNSKCSVKKSEQPNILIISEQKSPIKKKEVKKSNGPTEITLKNQQQMFINNIRKIKKPAQLAPIEKKLRQNQNIQKLTKNINMNSGAYLEDLYYDEKKKYRLDDIINNSKKHYTQKYQQDKRSFYKIQEDLKQTIQLQRKEVKVGREMSRMHKRRDEQDGVMKFYADKRKNQAQVQQQPGSAMAKHEEVKANLNDTSQELEQLCNALPDAAKTLEVVAPRYVKTHRAKQRSPRPGQITAEPTNSDEPSQIFGKMATTAVGFGDYDKERDSIVTPTLPMGEQDSGGINASVKYGTDLKFSAFDPTTQYSREKTPLNPLNQTGLFGSLAIEPAATYGSSVQNQGHINIANIGTPEASVLYESARGNQSQINDTQVFSDLPSGIPYFLAESGTNTSHKMPQKSQQPLPSVKTSYNNTLTRQDIALKGIAKKSSRKITPLLGRKNKIMTQRLYEKELQKQNMIRDENLKTENSIIKKSTVQNSQESTTYANTLQPQLYTTSNLSSQIQTGRNQRQDLSITFKLPPFHLGENDHNSSSKREYSPISQHIISAFHESQENLPQHQFLKTDNSKDIEQVLQSQSDQIQSLTSQIKDKFHTINQNNQENAAYNYNFPAGHNIATKKSSQTTQYFGNKSKSLAHQGSHSNEYRMQLQVETGSSAKGLKTVKAKLGSGDVILPDMDSQQVIYYHQVDQFQKFLEEYTQKRQEEKKQLREETQQMHGMSISQNNYSTDLYQNSIQSFALYGEDSMDKMDSFVQVAIDKGDVGKKKRLDIAMAKKMKERNYSEMLRIQQRAERDIQQQLKKNASKKMNSINKDLLSTTQRVSKQDRTPIGEIQSQRKFIPWGTIDGKQRLNTISKGEFSKRDDLNQFSDSFRKDSLMMESSVPFTMDEPVTNREYGGQPMIKGAQLYQDELDKDYKPSQDELYEEYKVNQPSGEELFIDNYNSQVSEMPTPKDSLKTNPALNKMGLNQASNFSEINEKSGENFTKMIQKTMVNKDKIIFGTQFDNSSKESIFQSSSILSNVDLKRSDQIIPKKKKLKPQVKFQFQTGSIAIGPTTPESSENLISDKSKEIHKKEFSTLRAKTQTNINELQDSSYKPKDKRQTKLSLKQKIKHNKDLADFYNIINPFKQKEVSNFKDLQSAQQLPSIANQEPIEIIDNNREKSKLAKHQLNQESEAILIPPSRPPIQLESIISHELSVEQRTNESRTVSPSQTPSEGPFKAPSRSPRRSRQPTQGKMNQSQTAQSNSQSHPTEQHSSSDPHTSNQHKISSRLLANGLGSTQLIDRGSLPAERFKQRVNGSDYSEQIVVPPYLAQSSSKQDIKLLSPQVTHKRVDRVGKDIKFLKAQFSEYQDSMVQEKRLRSLEGRRGQTSPQKINPYK